MVRRAVLVCLLLLNAMLLWTLVVGDHGVFAYWGLKDRRDRLLQSRDEADRISRELSQEIRLLSSDPAYQEKMVRERLNYVRQDEILYLFSDQNFGNTEGGVDAGEN